ncbi:hypothetical protein ABIE65_003132 [Constrictibacter sp. MBR-5]|jgi:hypothetical protein|uniref:hypothetical protein n=1 Tax=Constrictibacter sp. MBR-5 TaxID=3156467 RepID=UPI003399C598
MAETKMVLGRTVRNILGFNYRQWQRFLLYAKTPKQIVIGPTLFFAGESAKQVAETIIKMNQKQAA